MTQPGTQIRPAQRLPVTTVRGRQGVPRRTPSAPFTLTQQQQQHLNQVLAAWEASNKRINKMYCDFVLWEHNAAFNTTQQRSGHIKYKAPDKGLYELSELKADPSKGTAGQPSQKWICDGKSLYEYDPANKLVVERRLPPHLAGKAIVDGPLPFLFGQTAAQLKRRYFLRIVTPQNAAAEQIWIEAHPRFRADAANFQRAEMILTRADLLPFALQLHLPGGGQRHVYRFTNVVPNKFEFLAADFARPRLPFGWKWKVEEQPTPPQQPGGQAAQANQVPPRR